MGKYLPLQGSITAGTNSIVLQNVLAGSVSGALNAAVVAPLPIDNRVVKAGLSGLVTGGTTSAITGENTLQASVSRGIQAFSARAIAEGIIKVSSVVGQSLQEVNQPGNHETVIGILKHKSAYLMLEGDNQECNDYRLLGEQRYINHRKAVPKDKGHVRLDIINNTKSTVYDHKFGKSGLSADEVDKITQHAPKSVTSIKEVRPSSKGGITEKYPKPKP